MVQGSELQVQQPNCTNWRLTAGFPLTVTDNYSRYLLEVRGQDGTLHDASKRVFTRLFKEYGLPVRIRTDNGIPFAAASLGRLSRLSVWRITTRRAARTDRT